MESVGITLTFANYPLDRLSSPGNPQFVRTRETARLFPPQNATVFTHRKESLIYGRVLPLWPLPASEKIFGFEAL